MKIAEVISLRGGFGNPGGEPHSPAGSASGESEKALRTSDRELP